MDRNSDVIRLVPNSGAIPFVQQNELEDFFENGAVGLHLVAADGTIVKANKAELAMMGYSADEYVGRNIADFHADPETINDILQRLTRGEQLDKYPARLRTKEGSIRDVLITSSVRFQDGKFVNTRCFTLDITEAKRAQDQLAERELHFRQLLDALPAAIYTTDNAGIITYFNKAAVEFSGRVPQVGKDSWCVTWRLFSPDGSPLPHDECPMAITLREQRPVRNVEAIAERPDGSRVPFQPYPTPLRDITGEMTGAVNMLVDISDRKEAQRRQSLLVRELHHRVKNNLAMVQGIMSTTMRFSQTLQEFQSAFVKRIGALADTHNLLTEDEDQVLDFGALLQNEIAPYDDLSGRVTLQGETILLPPRLAIPIGLAVHELATNAVKYGALSVLGGRLSVTWTRTDTNLVINWDEFNVPDVSEPVHRGFGTQLLTKLLAQQVSANVAISFASDGLRAALTIPVSSAPGS